MTNIIENLYSQRRDKISYLVRCSKAHAKSFIWLDNRLARFFVNKNIGKYWKILGSKKQKTIWSVPFLQIFALFEKFML